jgi:hypothetical protein
VLKVEPSDITPNAMGVTPVIAAAGLGMPTLQSQRQGCAGAVDRDARTPVGGRRRRERADHRRQEQDRAHGA